MTEALTQLQQTLALDGYTMTVQVADDRAAVEVSAADGICGDCLVPKPVMQGMLEPLLGLPAAQISLLYPDEVAAAAAAS
jgi:hypothetical protein